MRRKEVVIILKMNRIIDEIENDIGFEWDGISPSSGEAIDFAHKYINPEPKRMIDDTHFSLEYCLAHYGQMYNWHFRRGITGKDEIAISKLISENSCKVDLVLYRGVCDEVYDLMVKNAKSFEGVDYLEKGFMHCSLVKGQELNCRKKLRIFVPAESHVIYIGNANNEQFFYEVDIQHGAKLKLISIDKNYYNCKLISTE